MEQTVNFDRKYKLFNLVGKMCEPIASFSNQKGEISNLLLENGNL